MDKPKTQVTDFLKSLDSVDEVLAEAGNTALPESHWAA